jgi:hypothetical protein
MQSNSSCLSDSECCSNICCYGICQQDNCLDNLFLKNTSFFVTRGWFGLSITECEQYKINFVKQIIDTYQYYHSNYASIILEYPEKIIGVNWDNSLSGGDISLAPDRFTSLPYNLTLLKNSQYEEIFNEFKKKALFISINVHGWVNTVSLGLTDNLSFPTLTTTFSSFLSFVELYGNPALFFDSVACQSNIVSNSNISFCCWPQTFLISGVWAYYLKNYDDFGKFFASEKTIGKTLLKIPSSQNPIIFGDITSHAPFKANSSKNCEESNKEKTNTPCFCPPQNDKDKMALIINGNGIYNNPKLISSLNSFILALYYDLQINGSIQKFYGKNFSELNLFIKKLYSEKNISQIIFIGEDFPIFIKTIEAEGDPIQIIISQEALNQLGRMDNSNITHKVCFDIVFSFILPPFNKIETTETNSFNCFNCTLPEKCVKKEEKSLCLFDFQCCSKDCVITKKFLFFPIEKRCL